MNVTTPETRANDDAFEWTAAAYGSRIWYDWGPYEWSCYYLFYKAAMRIERNAIADKIADKAKQGSYP